jgi:hypothetical protein
MRTLTLSRCSRPVRKHRNTVESLENRRMLAAHIVGSSTVYSTIQAAVDAALGGAVINVDAGSYKESVVVGKSLTIRGAQAGVDARTDTRLSGPTASESLVTGAGAGTSVSPSFKIIANDVTIDGFTVQGETSAGATGGIVLGPNTAGARILDNIVQNNVAGLVLSNNSPTDPAVIQFNVFRNNNNAGANGGRGIYTDETFFGSQLTNVTIDSNAFQGHHGSAGTTGFEAAIAVEPNTAGVTSNLRITNNTFDNNGKATLFFHTSNITITGNVITNAQDQWSGTLRFEGDDINVTISNNTLYNNTGPAVSIDAKGVPGNDSGFVINNNNFYGNSYAWSDKIAVIVDDSAYTGTLDARNNYWGSPSGPGGNGPGAGDAVWGNGHQNTGAEWSTLAGGSLTFSPFLTAPSGALDTPFWGTPSLAGPKIQAEDYDQGGINNAYFTTGSNSAGYYRDAESINIEPTSDSAGGYDVAKSRATDWLDYVVKVPATGTYELDFRVANGQTTAASFHVNVDGTNATGAISIPATGGWQNWVTLAKTGVTLTAGTHTLRIAYDANGNSGVAGSLNYFQILNTSVAPVPAAPSNLVATAISTSQINLGWTNNANNQTGFEIDRSTDGVNFSPLTNLAASATTYSDTSVAAAKTYYYRVEATTAAGPSPASNIASATTPAVASTAVNLSTLTWTSATTGWGTIQKNLSIKGNPLKLRGTTYATGIGTHANSTIVYNLAGHYVGFVSDVGVDDEVGGNGAVDFQLIGDGKVLFDSGILTGSSPVAHINVNITGVQQLTLVASNGISGSIDFDHADWAGAQLLLPSNSSPTAPSTLVATPISSSQINLTWSNTSSSQTSVKIQRSTDGVNFTDLTTVAGSATSYSNTALAASTAYTYRIFAINSNGSSPASNLASGTTLAANSTTTNLSSLTWTSATTGWGTIQKNLSIKGNPLKLRGTTYSTGIGTHANSTIVYNLAGKYSTFQTDIGVDDEVNGQGAVIFQVLADNGAVLYTSPTLTGASAVVHVSVSVAGVQNLTLIANTATPGNIDYDHADWAGAKLLS